MDRLKRESPIGRVGKSLKRALCFLKAHAGQIGYYAGVTLVLAAIALAAEHYRSGSETDRPLVLPAVELATSAPKSVEPLFEMPSEMSRTRDFSAQPEWNAMHRQWETHTALDYEISQGSVCSVSNGVVQTIGRSGVYGGFVEVETGEYLIRYASITPSDTLSPGERVKKGMVLGKTDESMPGEAYMGAHLHLELYRNGQALNFEVENAKKISAAD